MHHAAAGKVVEAPLCQPPCLAPAPVRGDGVDQPGDDGGEDDVAIEVAPLGDGAGHDRGASGRESALMGKEKKMQSV